VLWNLLGFPEINIITRALLLSLGGASGIGYALASKCVSMGMRVVIGDIRQKSLNEAKLKLLGTSASAEVLAIPVDVRDFERFCAHLSLSLLAVNIKPRTGWSFNCQHKRDKS